MRACLHADLQWTKTLVLHGRRGRPNELACKLADGWCWFCMVDAGSDFFACIQRPDGSIIVKKIIIQQKILVRSGSEILSGQISSAHWGGV